MGFITHFSKIKMKLVVTSKEKQLHLKIKRDLKQQVKIKSNKTQLLEVKILLEKR